MLAYPAGWRRGGWLLRRVQANGTGCVGGERSARRVRPSDLLRGEMQSLGAGQPSQEPCSRPCLETVGVSIGAASKR
jgi:hypothetical protein